MRSSFPPFVPLTRIEISSLRSLVLSSAHVNTSSQRVSKKMDCAELCCLLPLSTHTHTGTFTLQWNLRGGGTRPKVLVQVTHVHAHIHTRALTQGKSVEKIFCPSIRPPLSETNIFVFVRILWWGEYKRTPEEKKSVPFQKQISGLVQLYASTWLALNVSSSYSTFNMRL